MKLVTEATIADLIRRAAATPRRRLNLNLHDGPEDPINRFLNAGLPGTYARPHRHRIGKWEMTNVLSGMLDVVTFNDSAIVTNRWTLAAGGTSLIEILGGCWHSVVFRPPAAAVLEVKAGPFEPALDKEFALWAPAEGDAAVPDFMSWLESASAGERWPGAYSQT